MSGSEISPNGRSYDSPSRGFPDPGTIAGRSEDDHAGAYGFPTYIIILDNSLYFLINTEIKFRSMCLT